MSRVTDAWERLRPHIWPLIKFCIVGVVNTLTSYAVYLLLLPIMPYLAAHISGWIVGVIISYLLNARYTYGVQRSWKTFALYPLSSLPNIILSSIGVVVMIELLHWSKILSPLIATLLAVPFAYAIARVIMVRPEASTDSSPKA